MQRHAPRHLGDLSDPSKAAPIDVAARWLNNSALLQRSLVHMASANTLFALVQRLLGGMALDIAIVGASVAQAGGCVKQPAKRCIEYNGRRKVANPVPPYNGSVRIKGFMVRLLEVINTTWPAEHRLFNGGADATPVSLIAECLFSHIPRNPNLVILEFGSMAGTIGDSFNAVEAIVRTLLDVPTPPALVFLTVREWAHRSNLRTLTLYGPSERTAWTVAEERFEQLCRHYEQSCISYHAALSPLLTASPPQLELLDVASDGLHPSTGRLGVAFLTAMVTHWLRTAVAVVSDSNGWNSARLTSSKAPTHSPLPPPLWAVDAHLTAAGSSRCYGFGRILGRGRFAVYQRAAPIPWRTASCSEAHTPLEQCAEVDRERACPRRVPAPHPAHGQPPTPPLPPPPRVFVYCYEAFNKHGLPGKRSPGALALTPNATIELPVDTRLSTRPDGATTTAHGASSLSSSSLLSAIDQSSHVTARVTLAYLTSYAGGMGRAHVSCARGCACDSTTLDSFRVSRTRNVSVFARHMLEIRGHASAMCIVRVRVLPESSTDGHKFKLGSLLTVSVTGGGYHGGYSAVRSLGSYE